MAFYEEIFVLRQKIFTVNFLEAKDCLQSLAINWGPWDASYTSF